MAKRRRARKRTKPKDSRLKIAGEPFAAIASLFGKGGSSRPNRRKAKGR